MRKEPMVFRTAIFACVWLLLVLMPAFAMADGNPVADGRAVVMCGKARFTVLTSRLIRMEWSGDGVFEDNATLFAVNRRMNLADYTVKRSNSHTGHHKLPYLNYDTAFQGRFFSIKKGGSNLPDITKQKLLKF